MTRKAPKGVSCGFSWLAAALLATAAVPSCWASAPESSADDTNWPEFAQVLATFTTRFDESDAARSRNIGLAVEKIRGAILKPGDEFSFNSSVGERTVEAGFLSAPVLTPLGRSQAVGGGVCQVSSTLYNAALLADLEITRREPHSAVVPYVGAGRDATVGDFKDFRFNNPHAFALLIEGQARKGRVIFRILAQRRLGYDVRIETEVRRVRPQEQDSRNIQFHAPVKNRGGAGDAARVYRVAVRDGREISREIVSEDSYAPGHIVEGDG